MPFARAKSAGQVLTESRGCARNVDDSSRHGVLLSRHLTDVSAFVLLQRRILDERRRR